VIVWLQSTESTMKYAAEAAAAGEPHGTVVVAEEQTAGIGRHGHSWDSQPGGLYLSIILRVDLAPVLQPVLTMALGVATERAIRDLTVVACDLRWPNDILLNERKVAGILVQQADMSGVLIAGIGVNVNQRSFPPELTPIATSLRIETGEQHSKHKLLERIVAESLRYSNVLIDLGKVPILREFETRSTYVRGKQVLVDLADRTIFGVTTGLDGDGFLCVKTPEGRTETVIAGGVRAL